MTTPASIAAKLTEAQRAWVSSPDREVFEITEVAATAEPEWNEMTRIGVADYWTDRLTPLGLAVRAILQETEREG